MFSRVVCSTTLQEVEPIIEQPDPIEGQGVSGPLSNPGANQRDGKGNMMQMIKLWIRANLPGN